MSIASEWLAIAKQSEELGDLLGTCPFCGQVHKDPDDWFCVAGNDPDEEPAKMTVENWRAFI